MTYLSHTTSLISGLLLCLASAYAKKGGSGGHSTSGSSSVDLSFSLDLSSLNAATFSFNIIFIVFTLVQLLACYKLRRTNSPEENFPRRTLFRWILAVAILCLLASYGLSATIVAHDKYNGSWPGSSFYASPLNPAIYGMGAFTQDLADILIYLALMVLIQHRCKALSNQDSKVVSSARMNPLLSIVPFVLMGLMLTSSLIHLILYCVLSGQPILDEVMLGAYRAFSHIRLVFYLFLTISFIVASTTLWRHVRASSPPSPEHHRFDRYVLAPIQKILCVIFVIRAAYELAIYIPHFVDPSLNVDILDLTYILLVGFLYFTVVSIALRIGKIPKGEVQQAGNIDSGVHY